MNRKPVKPKPIAHKLSFVMSLWWVMACAITGLFLLVTAPKNARISETENRMLQGFPALTAKRVLSADFMTDFEDFLSDAFFARDEVIAFSNGLVGSFSLLSQDDAIANRAAQMEADLQNAALTVDPAPENSAEDPAAQSQPPEQDPPQAEIEPDAQAGDFPITDQHSYLWFKKTDGTLKIIYTYDREKIAVYADTLRLLQTYLPADGQICFTQVPLASIANRWAYQQAEYCDWGSSVEAMLEDCLQGTERIRVFSTYDILRPYITGDTPMFYYTDHHWSAEGAYIVCSAMLEAQGMPVIPYEDYAYKAILSAKVEDGRHDTFNAPYPLLEAHSYVMTRRDNAKEIDLMNFKSTSYLVYMNNTRLPWRKIVTGAHTGRKALVLCDSFGNAFTPYLLAYYDEVHMADFRNGSFSAAEAGGSIGDLITYHGIDDVYIVTSTANGLRKDNSIVYLRKYLTES